MEVQPAVLQGRPEGLDHGDRDLQGLRRHARLRYDGPQARH
jgi:hypothetical protein